MDNEEVNAEFVRSVFKNVRTLLDKHLTSTLICDEDAYITFRCFLDGMHHKFTKLLEVLLLKQENMYRNNKHEHIDDTVIPLLLKLLWLQIHEPTLKWFERWFCDIMRLDNKRKFRVFRRFHIKMVYLFKLMHRYYYKTIEFLCEKYDMRLVIPDALFARLNIIQLTDRSPLREITILNTSNPLTFSIVISFQRCLINLGSAHLYRTLLNKPSSHPKRIEDFKKSIRYLNIASLCLPAVGDTYFQLAKIYLSTEKFSLYFFELIRGSLVRIPSEDALICLKDFILAPNFSERKHLVNKLEMFTSKSLRGEKVLFESRIVLQFLSMLEQSMVPHLLNASHTANHSVLREYLQSALPNHHSAKINIIFENLTAMIGSFDLMFSNEKSKEERNKLKYVDLCERQVLFLDSSFDFIASMIDVVIIPSWQTNTEDFQYLATIRLLICWIKSYRSILQYTHRNKKFCTSFALLLNDLINSFLNRPRYLPSHRPRRRYYFEEDIILREFSCVNFALTDFNDDLVYNSPNMINNIIGCPTSTDRLSPKEECILRIKSIIFSGIKFLEKNDTGIMWNDGKYKFELVYPETKTRHKIALSEISFKINTTLQQERAVPSKNVEVENTEPQRKKARKIAVTELETQLANVRRTRKASPSEKRRHSLKLENCAVSPEDTTTNPRSTNIFSYPNEAIDADEETFVQVLDTSIRKDKRI